MESEQEVLERTIRLLSSHPRQKFKHPAFMTGKATGLKERRQGHLQGHYLHTKFHPNLAIGSKVIRGGGGQRQIIKVTFHVLMKVV
jgi:hypothetical protein